MELWTEIKCFACSRVCGEAPGKGDHLVMLRGAGRLVPGPLCTLEEGQLRCSRCGSLVYPGETFSSYGSGLWEAKRAS